MLQIHRIAHEHNPLFGPIFEDITFSVSRGEKVALVGPNGCGKSTIMKLVTGEIPLQKGRIIKAKGTKIAYLQQDFEFGWTGSAVEKMLANVPIDEYAEAEARMRSISALMGLPERCLEAPSIELSLGERTRATLAGLLAGDANLLLLDEPTNHLDLEARLALEHFLSETPQAVLMVCHDRRLLDETVDRTLELRRGILTEYAGGYSDMRREQALRHEQELEFYERSVKENRRLKNAAERIHQNAINVASRPSSGTYDPKHSPFYKARAAKVDKKAKAVRSRIEKLQSQEIEKPFEEIRHAIIIPAAPMHSTEVASLSDVWLDLGGKELFKGLSLFIERGSRVALMGPNGSGKTTLIQLLLGEIQPDKGDVSVANGARIGYLSQARNNLADSLPLLDALALDGRTENLGRTLLGCMDITGDASLKLVRSLSVGERTKAELVGVLAKPVNLLILDEPTNHLDIASIESLETALLSYQGSCVFVTHDREFAERVATEVVMLG